MKFILPLLLLLTGCLASMPVQKLNPATYYINDVCFTYETDKNETVVPDGFGTGDWWDEDDFGFRSSKEKVTFCGVGVLPYQDSYDLQVDNEGKLNFFSMTSCHREITTENSDDGIFHKNGRIKINYKPTLEKGRACPLFVAAFNRKGKHGWGFLAFEHPRFQLPAKLKCNGSEYRGNGVSVCQSRLGLIQTISFEEEVVPIKPVNGAAERKELCPTLPTEDNKTFEYMMPTRECVYGFVGKKSKKIHKFYSIGYEQLIIRGD